MLGGCAGPGTPGAPAGTDGRVAGPPPSATVPTARVGRSAASTRVRFVPRRLELPGAAAAPVVPARTVDGLLRVPEDVQQVGWWDGSAYAGDPFGSTVIAGHVDSVDQGFGFFARLLMLRVGDRVTVRSGTHHLTYRVTRTRAVERAALATQSAAFDQTGDHRLVLITCTGPFDRSRGGYADNLVVVAEPVGLAR